MTRQGNTCAVSVWAGKTKSDLMADMHFMPSELEITGIYFPPMLVAGTLGAIMMLLTVYLIRRYRLSRYFVYPQYVLAALWAIYTFVISTWVIPA